jgi:hypothetical protein
VSDRSLWTKKYDATAVGDPKYGSKPLRCSEGVMHQSKLEARRCTELHLMQKGGLIYELEAHPQPILRLDVNDHHICSYRPDFRYREHDNGELVLEDTKGVRTREYEIKKRLVKALLGLEIREVRR